MLDKTRLKQTRLKQKGRINKMKKTYKVDVDCAACAEKMQEAIKNTKGVKDATLSFMTLKCKVEFEDGVDPDAVIREARTNCKKIEDEFEIFID